MKHALTLAVAAAALTVGANAAQAGCAFGGKLTAGSFHEIPGFLTTQLHEPAAVTPPGAPGPNAAQNIVGTWLVTYKQGGKPFGQAFIQWHSDYTEWENINLPLDGGNICVGSWKAVDSTHVERLHYGWLYTSGLLSGYFTETETATVYRNSYTAVDDTTVYDVNGNKLAEVPGTARAVRIAP
jgi:hypothetical protein